MLFFGQLTIFKKNTKKYYNFKELVKDNKKLRKCYKTYVT